METDACDLSYAIMMLKFYQCYYRDWWLRSTFPGSSCCFWLVTTHYVNNLLSYSHNPQSRYASRGRLTPTIEDVGTFVADLYYWYWVNRSRYVCSKLAKTPPATSCRIIRHCVEGRIIRALLDSPQSRLLIQKYGFPKSIIARTLRLRFD